YFGGVWNNGFWIMQLSKAWLTQGLTDFGYKKYILLAYLKTVSESFGKSELYPVLSDLVFHYRNALAIRENKALLRESFLKELALERFRRVEVCGRKLMVDAEAMVELLEVVGFASPRSTAPLEGGTVIYGYVGSQCEICPVGVTPLYARLGYLFGTQPPE